MTITVDLPVDDLEIVQQNLSQFQERFKVEIISENFVVEHDEDTAEYTGGASMFDWKRVVLEMNNMNNFWILAKLVQQIKTSNI